MLRTVLTVAGCGLLIHSRVFQRLTRNRQFLAAASPGGLPQAVDMGFTWDLDDRRVSQTDALGRITRFVYDTAGRLTSTILPDGSTDLA